MSKDDGNPFSPAPLSEVDSLGLPAGEFDDFMKAPIIPDFRRSMREVKPTEPFDEYVTIDSVCQPGSTARFEFVAETQFRIDRLYFDEPIRGVTVKYMVVGFKRPKTFTRHIPMSWFCGVGKDGKLGQPITQFKALDLGERFIIEFDNQTHMSIRIIGVFAGMMLGFKT